MSLSSSIDPKAVSIRRIICFHQVARMGYDGDSVGVVEAWSIIQNTCQNYFEPDLSKSLCSGTRYRRELRGGVDL